MSIRDRFREIAHRLREIPSRLGLREYRVWVIVTSWGGAHFGEGSEAVTEVELTNANGAPPKVRFPNNRVVAAGIVQRGTVEVGPLTPEHTSRTGAAQGVSRLLLEAADDSVLAGQGIHLRIARGDEPGQRFRIVRIDTDRALQIMITAEPVGD